MPYLLGYGSLSSIRELHPALRITKPVPSYVDL